MGNSADKIKSKKKDKVKPDDGRLKTGESRASTLSLSKVPGTPPPPKFGPNTISTASAFKSDRDNGKLPRNIDKHFKTSDVNRLPRQTYSYIEEDKPDEDEQEYQATDPDVDYLLKEVMKRSRRQRELDKKLRENQKKLSKRYARLGGLATSSAGSDNDAYDHDSDRELISKRDLEKQKNLSSRVRRLSELNSESTKDLRDPPRADRKKRPDVDDEERPKRKNRVNDPEGYKERLLDDLIRLKRIEREKEARIDEQRREIRRQRKREIEKELRNCSSDADDYEERRYKPRSQSRHRDRGNSSGGDDNISKSSRSSGPDSKKSQLSLYLETTDSLYDDSGNLLANNSSVKFIGKTNAVFDPLKRRSSSMRKLISSTNNQQIAKNSIEPKPNLKEKDIIDILKAVEFEENKGNQSDEPAVKDPCEKVKYFYNGKEIEIDAAHFLDNKKAIVILDDKKDDSPRKESPKIPGLISALNGASRSKSLNEGTPAEPRIKTIRRPSNIDKENPNKTPIDLQYVPLYKSTPSPEAKKPDAEDEELKKLFIERGKNFLPDNSIYVTIDEVNNNPESGEKKSSPTTFNYQDYLNKISKAEKRDSPQSPPSKKDGLKDFNLIKYMESNSARNGPLKPEARKATPVSGAGVDTPKSKPKLTACSSSYSSNYNRGSWESPVRLNNKNNNNNKLVYQILGDIERLNSGRLSSRLGDSHLDARSSQSLVNQIASDLVELYHDKPNQCCSSSGANSRDSDDNKILKINVESGETRTSLRQLASFKNNDIISYDRHRDNYNPAELEEEEEVKQKYRVRFVDQEKSDLINSRK